MATLAQLNEFDASQASFEPPAPRDLDEIHSAIDRSVQSAEKCLSDTSEQEALGTWRLTLRGKELFKKNPLRTAPLSHAESLVP
jgi:hypothetical protein